MNSLKQILGIKKNKPNPNYTFTGINPILHKQNKNSNQTLTENTLTNSYTNQLKNINITENNTPKFGINNIYKIRHVLAPPVVYTEPVFRDRLYIVDILKKINLDEELVYTITNEDRDYICKTENTKNILSDSVFDVNDINNYNKILYNGYTFYHNPLFNQIKERFRNKPSKNSKKSKSQIIMTGIEYTHIALLQMCIIFFQLKFQPNNQKFIDLLINNIILKIKENPMYLNDYNTLYFCAGYYNYKLLYDRLYNYNEIMRKIFTTKYNKISLIIPTIENFTKLRNTKNENKPMIYEELTSTYNRIPKENFESSKFLKMIEHPI